MLFIKGPIHGEDSTVLNTQSPSTAAFSFIKQILLVIKPQINLNTVIVGDFSTSLIAKYRSFRQKANRETIEPNQTSKEHDRHIWNIPPKRQGIFSSAHRTFSTIEKSLWYNTNLKYREVEKSKWHSVFHQTITKQGYVSLAIKTAKL